MTPIWFHHRDESFPPQKMKLRSSPQRLHFSRRKLHFSPGTLAAPTEPSLTADQASFARKMVPLVATEAKKVEFIASTATISLQK